MRMSLPAYIEQNPDRFLPYDHKPGVQDFQGRDSVIFQGGITPAWLGLSFPNEIPVFIPDWLLKVYFGKRATALRRNSVLARQPPQPTVDSIYTPRILKNFDKEPTEKAEPETTAAVSSALDSLSQSQIRANPAEFFAANPAYEDAFRQVCYLFYGIVLY